MTATFEVRENGCWEWAMARNSRGYGVKSRGGRLFLAHRLAYEAALGPIPDGLQIDHLCRNRACVNPAHLEAVTQAENLRRGRGTRLTWNDVEFIRRSPRSARSIALELGIDPSYATQIRRGQAWRVAA